ncbi:MAG: hypothetical protein SWH78_01165 [Thermodesulfobacteriota bacterium]|nr:hypothetical protein [Thermodesulfobacteriota bacterium]
MEEAEHEKVDAFCPECGHAFKVYVDRVLTDDKGSDHGIHEPCPVCGCGDCKIGK